MMMMMMMMMMILLKKLCNLLVFLTYVCQDARLTEHTFISFNVYKIKIY
jgi:hypothetical protein